MSGFYTLTEPVLPKNSRSEQNFKNPEHPFGDIGKTETWAKFQQKILNSMVVGARQRFQFLKEIAWFSRNELCLNLNNLSKWKKFNYSKCY